MITKFPINFVTKPWGTEEWLVNNDQYCAKILTVKPGGVCSKHYHNVKNEHFLLQSGRLKINIDGTEMDMVAGDCVFLPAGKIHFFMVSLDCVYPAVVLEVSTHHDDNDVVRLNLSQMMTHATGKSRY